MNMNDGRENGSSSTGKTDGLSDDAMDLLHMRYELCLVELKAETVFLLSGDVNPSSFAFVRIYEMEGAHCQVATVHHMKMGRQREHPCPYFHYPPA